MTPEEKQSKQREMRAVFWWLAASMAVTFVAGAAIVWGCYELIRHI